MPDKQIYNAGYRAVVARLKTARLKAKLSQAQVALKMGVNRRWVSKIETCELKLDVLHFVRMCQVLGLRAREEIAGME